MGFVLVGLQPTFCADYLDPLGKNLPTIQTAPCGTDPYVILDLREHERKLTIIVTNNAAPVSRDGVYLGFSSIRRPSYATGSGRPTKWFSSRQRGYKVRGLFKSESGEAAQRVGVRIATLIHRIAIDRRLLSGRYHAFDDLR